MQNEQKEQKGQKTVNKPAPNKKTQTVKKTPGKPRGRKSTPTLNPGDNSKHLKYAMAVYDMPKINTGDINQVYKRTYWYLEQCIENNMRAGVVGLCLALGITRVALYYWQTGVCHGREHQEYALWVKTVIEHGLESDMMEGRIHPTVGIFLMKNNHGYKDSQDLNVSTPLMVRGKKELDEIEEKYIDSVIETDDDFTVE